MTGADSLIGYGKQNVMSYFHNILSPMPYPIYLRLAS